MPEENPPTAIGIFPSLSDCTIAEKDISSPADKCIGRLSEDKKIS